MSRSNQINYFPSRSAYYTQYLGKQIPLAKGPENEETYERAKKHFFKIMDGASNIEELVANITTFNVKPKSKNPIFYVIRLCPDLDPNRIKLGWTGNGIKKRIKSFRTCCPTLKIIKTWCCEIQLLEPIAMQYITNGTADLIKGEVYQLIDCKKLITQGDEFFKK
jgi:hypothetical protein